MNKRKRSSILPKRMVVPAIAAGVIALLLVAIVVAGLVIPLLTLKTPSDEIKQVQSSLDTLNLPEPRSISVEDNGCTEPHGQTYCFWAISYDYDNPDAFWSHLQAELGKNWKINSNEGGLIWAENQHVCLMVKYSASIDGENVGPSGNKGYIRAIFKGSNGCNH